MGGGPVYGSLGTGGDEGGPEGSITHCPTHYQVPLAAQFKKKLVWSVLGLDSGHMHRPLGIGGPG